LFDLLEHLLTIDPTKRYTAKECLKHAFFSTNSCDLLNLSQVSGESHEFLLRVQQANRYISSKDSMSHDFLSAPKKRALGTLADDNALIEPSTKEFNTNK
jgi:serine/threonine protein kinase